MKDGQLTLNLQPCVPSYLVGEEKEIEATFLGSVYTVYKLGDLCELIPGKYQIHKISLEDINGEVTQLTQVTGDVARALRDGTYVKMTVECV